MAFQNSWKAHERWSKAMFLQMWCSSESQCFSTPMRLLWKHSENSGSGDLLGGSDSSVFPNLTGNSEVEMLRATALGYMLLCRQNQPELLGSKLKRDSSMGSWHLIESAITILCSQGVLWLLSSLVLLLLFSRSVVSDCLLPHGLQHARLPYPSLSPGVCSNSCPLSWWYHPTISSSVVPFSSCLKYFPALQIKWPKYWNFSFSISPSSEYSRLISFRIWLVGIFLLFKGLSRVFSSTAVQKHQFFGAQSSLWSNSHIGAWLLEKP